MADEIACPILGHLAVPTVKLRAAFKWNAEMTLPRSIASSTWTTHKALPGPTRPGLSAEALL
jgi:hypothetical protein